MGIENSKTFAFFFMSLMVSFAVPFSHGFTNEQDGKFEYPAFLVYI